MNPLPMVRADLLAMRWMSLVVVVLIGLAVAIGIAVGAQERAIRQASAHAADDFDLLIGAPGSQTQLVMTSVYLQPEALPLIDGRFIAELAADRRVAASAPLAFGDVVMGHPVIGTTVDFVTRWGRVTIAQGRVFAAEGEAVIGADVRLDLGQAVTPSHMAAGMIPSAEQEHAHRHQGVTYTIVGRLPRLGSPWDRAILVPIESVWETHGLGNGHRTDDSPIGPPFDAQPIPGTPAIVIKPRTVADAYALRGQYRSGATMALFPAEILVSLYRTLGDVRSILVVASVLNDVLVFIAIVLLLVTLMGLRRRRYALLRALGASRLYVLAVTWLDGAVLLVGGCALGLLAGWGGAAAAGMILRQATGLDVPATPGWEDGLLAAGLALAGSLLATIPALMACRTPPALGLRG